MQNPRKPRPRFPSFDSLHPPSSPAIRYKGSIIELVLRLSVFSAVLNFSNSRQPSAGRGGPFLSHGCLFQYHSRFVLFQDSPTKHGLLIACGTFARGAAEHRRSVGVRHHLSLNSGGRPRLSAQRQLRALDHLPHRLRLPERCTRSDARPGL